VKGPPGLLYDAQNQLCVTLADQQSDEIKGVSQLQVRFAGDIWLKRNALISAIRHFGTVSVNW